MITAEARELRFAIDTNSVGRVDVEKAINTIEKQATRIAELDTKWRDYETNYRCGRRFGYCIGGSDDMPGACDFCWAARQ